MSLDIWLTIECVEDTGRRVRRYGREVFEGNYTSNVFSMWRMAGVDDVLYECAGAKAGELIDRLKFGVRCMRDNIDEYRKLNPPNGWGNADGALQFLFDFTRACMRYPNAKVGVWR